MSPPLDAAPFLGPIAVTVGYFGLWYVLLLGLQRGVKYRLRDEYTARGETFDRYFGGDRRMLAVDRAVANTQEQMVPFLASLWLHAVFVSTTTATTLGVAYIVLRAVYPMLLGRSLAGTQSKRVFAVTGPSYAIVFYLLGSVLYRALVAG